MSQKPNDPSADLPPASPGEGTQMESVEEIRKAFRGKGARTAKEAGLNADTPLFRPARRPSMALLCVLDDGSETGEFFRIRKDRFLIGRTDGDLVISHDSLMSGKHAEITRQSEDGQSRWLLTDLQSTNGTFVRISKTHLRPGQEVLIGRVRYRFSVAAPAAEKLNSELSTGMRDSAAEPSASLVELTPEGEGRTFLLPKRDNFIGRDSRHAGVVVLGNPLASPLHARVFANEQGNWYLENTGSRNGTWVRVTHLTLQGNGQFQLGEQRFSVRILG